MSRAAADILTVRRTLISETRDLHAALHQEPILARLTDTTISLVEYTAALGVFSRYYGAFEACRHQLGWWPAFSLAADCAALAKDLPSAPKPAPPPVFACCYSLLGGLYVAHGSAFGRSVFRGAVRCALPDLEHHFLSRRCDIGVWRALLETMEEQGQMQSTVERMQTGAWTSFTFMQTLSRAT